MDARRAAELDEGDLPVAQQAFDRADGDLQVGGNLVRGEQRGVWRRPGDHRLRRHRHQRWRCRARGRGDGRPWSGRRPMVGGDNDRRHSATPCHVVHEASVLPDTLGIAASTRRWRWRAAAMAAGLTAGPRSPPRRSVLEPSPSPFLPGARRGRLVVKGSGLSRLWKLDGRISISGSFVAPIALSLFDVGGDERLPGGGVVGCQAGWWVVVGGAAGVFGGPGSE